MLVVALTLSLVSGQVQQLGDGRDGPLEVSTAGVVVNRQTPLSADAAAGDPFVLVVDATPFSAGAVVLLVQSQWKSDGERYRVGEFSLHAIARVVGPRLEFTSPLTRPWRVGETQVVLVPQYTDVVISSGGSLEAPPWNGSSGGVLAFFATGGVRNDGAVSAAGKGLRGGTTREAPQSGDCPGADEPAPRGAERGEGVLVGGFGSMATGRRANDSGGGGGNCVYAGGGGGGSLGEGGQGGFGEMGKDVGGQGGAALAFAGLVLGGGGGASNGSFGQGRNGGRGGGAIFVRARSLDGSGSYDASGQGGVAPSGRFGGASGAGAGGSVVLEVVDTARCSLSANGGAGGDGAASGPGGGGGGGNISLRAGRVVECPMSVAGGLSGRVGAVQLGALEGQPGKSVAREVSAQSMPFESGPGVTISRVGCSLGPSAPLLALASLLLRRRARGSGSRLRV